MPKRFCAQTGATADCGCRLGGTLIKSCAGIRARMWEDHGWPLLSHWFSMRFIGDFFFRWQPFLSAALYAACLRKHSTTVDRGYGGSSATGYAFIEASAFL